MDSKAALHSGCGQAAGPTLTPPQRSSASSTPGTTRTTDASPLRAKADIMVRAAGAPRLRRHRASAAGSNQAADRSAVLVAVAHLASQHLPGPCRSQLRARHSPLPESYPGQRRSGRGHRSGPHRPGQYAHPAGARWCEMAMSSNWTRRIDGTLTDEAKTPRSRAAQRNAGKPDRLPTDDGGHFIANRFNGPSDAFNHFAQDASANRGAYRVLEQEWADALAQRKTVKVTIIPNYPEGSRRPSQLKIFYSIDGVRHQRTIDNSYKPKAKDQIRGKS